MSNFVGLFTDEEVAEWVKAGNPPDWVVLGMAYFVKTASAELMERLAEDD